MKCTWTLDNDYATRPIRELSEVEHILETTQLEHGRWHLASVRTGDMWRVVLIVEALDFLIATPAVYTSREAACDAARSIGLSLGGVPWAKGGTA